MNTQVAEAITAAAAARSAAELRRQAAAWERRGEAEYAAGEMVDAHDCWQRAQALLSRASEIERCEIEAR